MPLRDKKLYPIGGIIFDAENSHEYFTREELRQADEYSLTQEPLNGRRYAIVHKCGGGINVFNREYPHC